MALCTAFLCRLGCLVPAPLGQSALLAGPRQQVLIQTTHALKCRPCLHRSPPPPPLRSRKTGYGNYGPAGAKGARIIRLRQGESAALSATWIRTEDGQRVDQDSMLTLPEAKRAQPACGASEPGGGWQRAGLVMCPRGQPAGWRLLRGTMRTGRRDRRWLVRWAALQQTPGCSAASAAAPPAQPQSETGVVFCTASHRLLPPSPTLLPPDAWLWQRLHDRSVLRLVMYCAAGGLALVAASAALTALLMRWRQRVASKAPPSGGDGWDDEEQAFLRSPASSGSRTP